MKKAVTLLELLIVVLIIGVLATIAVPRFTNMMLKAKTAEGWMNLDAVRKAVMIYRMENDAPPVDGNNYLIFSYLDIGNPNTAPDGRFNYFGRGFSNYYLNPPGSYPPEQVKDLSGSTNNLRLMAFSPRDPNANDECTNVSSAWISQNAEIILYMDENGTQRFWHLGKENSGSWHSD